MVVKRRVGELEDGLWDIVSRSLDGNVIVLLEVDTGLLLGGVIEHTEELALETGVGWSRDVFSISPLSVTAATSSTSASTSASGSGVAVCVLVEASLGGIPATWASAARGEVGSVGISPVATRAGAVTCETVGSACQYKLARRSS